MPRNDSVDFELSRPPGGDAGGPTAAWAVGGAILVLGSLSNVVLVLRRSADGQPSRPEMIGAMLGLAWSGATALGLLRRRAWAPVSAMVIAALSAAVVAATAALLKDAQLPARPRYLAYVGCVSMVAGWFILLSTDRRVANPWAGVLLVALSYTAWGYAWTMAVPH